jgi:hypothetical protein
MPGALLPSRMRQTLPSGGSEAPAPGLIDTFVAGSRVGVTDSAMPKDLLQSGNYFALMEAVGEVNGKSLGDYRPWSQTLNQFVPFSSHLDVYDLDALWSDISEIKKRNPQALQGISTREAFEKGLSYRGANADRDNAAVQRGNVVASFAGQAVGGLVDPINILGAGVGAKTLRGAIGLAMLEGGSLELAQEGLKRKQAKMAGIERSASDVVWDVSAAAVGSGVLGAGAYGIGKNWDAIKAAPKAVQEKLWAQIAPALPESIRPKMDWDAIGDDMLPDIAEAVIGRENLSEAEADALAVVRREAEIAASNPFIPDGAGIKAHQEGLAEAMERILRDMPNAPASPRPVAPGATLPRLRGSTSLSTGVVAGDARAILKSRIGIVESDGNNAARNPNSSAVGIYQFLSGTWVKLYKSRYGDGGLTDAQIAAKRRDPRLQEILMDDLMTINERSLQKAGHAADAGNMYLAHFAGPNGANKLLAADPNASARSVLGDRAVEANAFLQNMTAADVIQWAHRKMTGKGAPRGTDAFPRETVDPEAGLRARLDDELERIEAERARLDAEDAAEVTPIGDLIEAEMTPIGRGPAEKFIPEDFDAPSRPLEPIARLAEAPPVEILAIMPQLRAIVRSRETSLNEPAKLAKALGVDEGQLRQGLTALALNREIRQNKKGQFMRLPRDNGPVDMLKFIGRAGGLTEDGLAPGARDIIGGSQGHALGKNGRDYNRLFIPGSGPLVRKGGSSIDAMGEKLHEAGYFGDPQGPRPTEAQVLEAIDLAATQGKKIYPFGMTPEGRPVNSRDPWIDEFDRADMQRAFEREADDRGYALDDAAFEAAARLYYEGDYENIGAAIVDMINREIEADMAAKYYELGDAFDEERAAQFIAGAQEDGFILDEGFNGPTILAGDTGAVGTPRGNVVGQFAQEAPTELNPEIYRAFDDPVEGAGAAAQIASMEHDLRAGVQRNDFELLPDSDTRGQGVQYHGARNELPDLSEGYYNPANIYGGFETFYTTDAIDIAGGYRRKSGDGLIYRIEEVSAVERFDMEQQQSVEFWHDLIPSTKADVGLEAMALEQLIGAKGSANLREIMDEIRDESRNEGIQIDEVQEIFDGIIFNLQQRGYRAMTHIGGLKTDRAHHNVTIYFNAPNDLRLVPLKASEPVKEAIIDPGIAERQAQQAALKAASPMQAKVDQESTIGSPLFDAVDQYGFRLDAEGDVINPADLLAEIEADRQFFKTVKDCL